MLKRLLNKINFLIKNILLCICSCFWKRDKKIILFGAWFGEKFADNSRFLFQYLSKNKEKLGLTHVIWVTRNEELCAELNQMDYEAYLMNSKESYYYHKKAGMHLICNSASNGKGFKADICSKYSYGAVRVNLWHGVGVVKGVGCASLEYKRRKEQHKYLYFLKELIAKTMFYRKFVLERGGWGDFYFLSPTKTTTFQFKQFAFFPDEKFIASAYPRTCECCRYTLKEKQILDIISRFEKIILYLPTFRTGKNDFDFTVVSEQLNSVILEEDILWIQKSHSASLVTVNDNKCANVLNLSPDFDINVLMPYITLLITDYSSAASDARFFDKAILFYVPDYEQYISGDNGITAEAEELLSGPKYDNIIELEKGIRHYINNPEEAKSNNYYFVKKKYWGDAKRMEDIWNDIIRKTRYF